MPTYTATYSPDDNKLRLYASTRLDPETYARVKAAGFTWAPKQGLFVAPMWTPAREDLALELAGEIGDEDTSLVDRAEERADRFGDYSDRRAADGDAARKAVAAIADNIPFGQPILVGHHSERHARKDAERIENGMRKAVKMWETASYWKSRAAGAIRAAKYKERPDVRARRIKTLEAEQRKVERTQNEARKALAVWQKIEAMGNDPDKQHAAALAFTGNTSLGSLRVIEREGNSWWSAWDVLLPDERRYQACPSWTVSQVIEAARPIYARILARCDRWRDHYENRLEYERAMLADQGGLVTDWFESIEIGGQVKVGRDWLLVTRVNRSGDKIVSVTTNSRYVRVKGIEEVTDYKAPSAEDTAAVKAATALAPLVNYPGEGFAQMTQEQFNRIPKDYRGTNIVKATETTQKHRVRSGLGTFVCRGDDNKRHSYVPIYITDAKTVTPGAPAPSPSAPPLPQQLPPDLPAQIDRSPDTIDQQIFEASAILAAGIKVAAVPQLFPTPAAIADEMATLARIQPGQRILEPSAGTGNLLAAIDRARGHVCEREPACEIIAVELDHRLAAAVPAHLCANAIQADFLTCNGNLGTFDRIVMNPPFGNGADIKHIRHAMNFLKPGGRLVAICADGPRQHERLKPIASRWMPLPAGTFADQGTDVRTAMLIIDAPAP